MRECRSAVLVLLITLALVPAMATAGQSASIRWAASRGDFVTWQLSGVSRAADGALQLFPGQAWAGTDPYGPGGYHGGTYYNGGSFVQGEATSPIITSAFSFREAIASWEATTPTGTWVETFVRVQVAGAWTKWFSLGVWASEGATVRRHSVDSQADTVARVSIDTLLVTAKKSAASAWQVKTRLFSADGVATPTLHASALTFSTSPEARPTVPAGNPARWNQVLDVPRCSQMVYPDGGEVWCSPTSTAMVLKYWLQDTGGCESSVRAAVSGTHDWYYGGHGNWPFNTAYAARQGFQAHVARFTSFAQLEPWLSASVPAILSVAWGKGELTGAPIPSTAGHLLVLAGFDATGNPVVNDPAGAGDTAVRRTYFRSELEPLWLSRSGGTAYLIYPRGWPVPAL
ncbi:MULTISPECIES: C39 family peptidase [unclassified Myxococcus]|uniref:C39 family peptidase n=1 Tax=unclassified Myxococcus TaxID=2648731 RepID=UPI00157A5B97|nr:MULTISPECIES: C39 family peptidase [unclassified Myxococcus]NTX35042.1 C39 family peptidase [Myxococcus sp. CA033]NTX56067.1 C39 family peptidase [Myxococcus sp. CA039A]